MKPDELENVPWTPAEEHLKSFRLGRIEQLMQLRTATWDGDLISKKHRLELVKLGLADQSSSGYNIITPKGLDRLYELGLIHP